MFQTPIDPAERQAIMALRGTMSAEAAGKQLKRHPSSVIKIWKAEGDYVAFHPRPPHSMSPRQVILLDRLREAGKDGILLSDLTLSLRDVGYSATAESHRSNLSHMNYKLLGQGKPERIRRISKPNEPARYALIAIAAPVVKADVEWTPSIPSMSSRVKTESGACISVARVSFLAGASA
jgi:hypothetical protein